MEHSDEDSEDLRGIPEDEELNEQPQIGRENRGGTSLGTWVAVFGSSAVFHALLLILLGLIIISEPTEDPEEVTLEVPDEEEEEEVTITKRDIQKEVQKDAETTNPQVETTENVEEVDSEMTAEAGQNLTFNSDTQNNEQVERSIALSGGGKGGTYGQREGAGLSGSEGGGGASQKAVEAGLMWLARHQNEKGKWERTKYVRQCPEKNKCEVLADGNKPFDAGLTGLALLAFLGAGYTHNSDEKLGGVHVGKMINRTLRWFKNRQKNNGAFDTSGRQMYNHSIATMAFAEAYGMTGAPRLKRIAQKGVDFLEQAQNESDGKLLGWRYRANSGDSDTSVTGWCAMALKSAELAGLETSKEAMQGAMRWVEQNTNDQGLTGYNGKPGSRGSANKPMTPVGMMVRMFAHETINKKQLKRLKQGADYVVNTDGGKNYYYWYYGSLSLFMFAGPGTPFEDAGYWQKWNPNMKKTLLTRQQTARHGHEMGSWDPDAKWGDHGERVYVTAVNTLTLEVYYRYDNALFQ